MHQALSAEARSTPIVQWELKLRDAESRKLRQAQVFDRELFYAVQPAERLNDLLERCATAFQ